VSPDPDPWSPGRLPLVARVAVAVLGVGVMWAGVLVAESRTPVDLTVVLLVLLTVVLGLAVTTGPLLGIVSGLVAVVLVNWYLVPPYRTFEVANPDNVVTLVVFALVAGVASVLAELNARVRAGALRSRARAGLIADVVAKGEVVDPELSLERVRQALELDRLSLVRGTGIAREVLATVGTGPDATSASSSLEVAVPGGYRLLGVGPERMAEDPGFVESLAAAAVRSYESDRMETEQRRAQQLAAVDSARTALLASVGHDLRTPLAGLRLAVDALRDSGAHLDDETRDDLLETVDSSTSRLDELITNLLDMSRLEAGVLAARVEPTAVDAVLAAAVLAWPNAAVQLEVSDTLPLVLADPALLERVVENLVSNALRYAGPTVERPVLVSASVAGADGGSDDASEGAAALGHEARVVVRVVDHGPGLGSRAGAATSPVAPGIGRADRSAGLGLAIVRGFCAAMGVDAEFLTTEGGGLTVHLEIPVAEATR
jgi:K+-sensing histidine kinase KdpD